MNIKNYPHKLYNFRSGIISLDNYIALPECYELIEIQVAYSFEEAYKIVENDFDNLFEAYKRTNNIIEDPDFEHLVEFNEDVYPNRFLLLNPGMIDTEKAKEFMHHISNVIGLKKSKVKDYDEFTDEIFESIMEAEELILLKFNTVLRNIELSPIVGLADLMKFYYNLNFEERNNIEPGGYRIGPKYIDLVDRFFYNHEDCIRFFVNAKQRIVPSNNDKAFAILERTHPNKWTYTLEWDDGKSVGEYIKPFKPTYENFVKFNIGAKILADQLRYYIWVNKIERVTLIDDIFDDLTFKNTQ